MSVLTDIGNLLMPRYCLMCHHRLAHQEKYICTVCLMHLPFTNYHQVKHSVLEKQFWGLLPIEKAVSFFYHDGADTRQLIYHIKYFEHPELGTYLGSIYAEELKRAHFFDHIDMIIPLPLHWRRQMKRHYNQCHYIAKGIAKVTGLPIKKNVVKRKRNNTTQTHLTPHQRMENVKDVFLLKHPEEIEGKHILLIDDVTTTGATLIACGKELIKAGNVKLSILTLSVSGGRTTVPDYEGEHVETSIFGIPLME